MSFRKTRHEVESVELKSLMIMVIPTMTWQVLFMEGQARMTRMRGKPLMWL
jgi:hypothetical protein